MGGPVLSPNSTCEDVLSWLHPGNGYPVILQLVNEGYVRMQSNFIIVLKKNAPRSLENLFLLCIDDESTMAMKTLFGIRCVEVNGVISTKKDEVLRLRRNHQIWIFRTKVLACLVEGGRDVLMSDNDAMWLQDPLPDLQHIPGDILIQRGHWPHIYADPQHGVTICMGFALFRTGAEGMPVFLREMKRIIAVDGDDQYGVNIAAQNMNITWDYRNSDMRFHNSTGLGTAVVTGLPGRFQITYLPHNKYTRNCQATPVTTETIIAHCFPRTDREEAMKNATLWFLDSW